MHWQPRRGLTLAEIAVSVLLGAIVLLAASQMLSSGMKTSTKGSAHLTNVQATSLLMSQIEEDVQRAVDVSFNPPGNPEPSAKFVILEEQGGKVATCAIIYERAGDPQGIKRTRDPGGGAASEVHAFCRGLKVLDCSFTRLDLEDRRIGFKVVLKTGTYPTGSEEFTLERFILCRNHASNSISLGWQTP